MDYYRWVDYLKVHYLEILGTITGLIYIVYSIRQKRVLWIFGGISSFFYILVFYRSGLLAYMVLYFYYVAISLYGWFSWAPSQQDGSGNAIRITRLKTGTWILAMSAVLLLWGIIYGILGFIKNSEMPIADAFLTAGSIVATWLLVRKIIDHWIMWVVIDLITAIISVVKGLPFTAFLFFIYTLLAIKGYLEWKKNLVPPIQN